jgi:hypothetical protein
MCWCSAARALTCKQTPEAEQASCAAPVAAGVLLGSLLLLLLACTASAALLVPSGTRHAKTHGSNSSRRIVRLLRATDPFMCYMCGSTLLLCCC